MDGEKQEEQALRLFMLFRSFRIFIILAISAFELSACHHDISKFESLAVNYRQAEATITAVNCGNHGAFSYSYREGGRTFFNEVSFTDLNCRSLKIGQNIQIYHAVSDPSFSIVGTPQQELEKQRATEYYIPWWVWFATIFFAEPAYAYWLRRKKRHSI